MTDVAGDSIAALYDIHGNLPALEAVLDEVRAAEVDRIVVGGDVVPGPMPCACLAALATVSVPVDFIRGNGENDVLTAHRGEPLVRVPEPFHEVVRWVTEALEPSAIQAMVGWPATIERGVGGVGRVLFCHATPRDDNELFTGDLDAAQQRMAESGYPGIAQLDVRSPPSAEAMLQTFEAAALQAGS